MKHDPRLKNWAAWLFKCNLEVWDLRSNYSADEQVGGWRLHPTYRVDEIEIGDPFYLWVTGSGRVSWMPGVWGAGEVIDLPQQDQGGGTDWRNKTEMRKTRPYVPVEIEYFRPVVARADLLQDRRFRSAEIIRQPAMGNPLILTADEVAAIEDRR